MKKHYLIVVIIILITALSGCLSTLHPLFTEKDLVFEPRLLGAWTSGTGNNTAVFEKGNPELFKELPGPLQKIADKGYFVSIEKDGKLVRYHAFLCRIGKELYLDYFPAETPRQKLYDVFYKAHFIKMHSFYRVRFKDNNSFEIGQFDEAYLRNLIDKKQVRIQYEERFDESYLITAPTEELQQYVIKYGDNEAAYNSSTKVTYHKKP
jgi:hypothetical protein